MEKKNAPKYTHWDGLFFTWNIFMHTTDCPRCLLIFHPHINECSNSKFYINHNEYKRNVIDLKSESNFYVYMLCGMESTKLLPL